MEQKIEQLKKASPFAELGVENQEANTPLVSALSNEILNAYIAEKEYDRK